MPLPPVSPAFRRLLSGCLGLMALAATALALSGEADTDFAASQQNWRAQRIQRLSAEDGWLTLVGLDWLLPGENLFGSAPDNRVVLHGSGIPAVAGALILEEGKLRTSMRAGSDVVLNGRQIQEAELQDDEGAEPSILHLGTLSIQIVKRGERWAARVKDSASPVRTGFRGLEWYAPDPRFRVDAVLQPYPAGHTLPILNILGLTENDPCPGVLEFALLGQHFRLEPVQEGDSQDLFLMIADATSGKETYGAGRYIAVTPGELPGHWTIDFNHAYNPPCAFTAFATCPLPPRGNRMAIAVTAGEKKYAGGHGE